VPDLNQQRTVNEVNEITDITESCRFVERADSERTAVVQLDKLRTDDNEVRSTKMAEILARVGETPTAETDDFLRRWPIVHKVSLERERQFRLTDEMKSRLLVEVPELGTYMKKMGYFEPL